MKSLRTHMISFSLTDDQIKFYDENGYLKLEKVWSGEEVGIIKKDLDDFANDFFTNKLDAHYHKSIKTVHRSKKMCDIGDAILRERAIPIGSIAFYCKPNNSLEHGSTWHQDNYAGKSPDGNNYLNLAIALDDADEA